MGVFSRLSDIINSNINAMLDKAEDPEKVVRLIVQEMEDTLVEVRSAAARSIADRKTLDRRIGQAKKDADEWQRRAELAVTKGRDDLARAALNEKRRAAAALDALEQEHKAISEGLDKLNGDIAALQAKLADAKGRQKALLARHEAATQQLRLRRHTHDERIDDALGRFEHFEHKLENMEGRVEAYDLGKKRDLDREFDDLEGGEEVDADLAELKARMASDDED